MGVKLARSNDVFHGHVHRSGHQGGHRIADGLGGGSNWCAEEQADVHFGAGVAEADPGDAATR